MTAVPPDNLKKAEGYETELDRLKTFLRDWIDKADAEVRPLLDWQFLGRSKYYRPVTLFTCHDAVSSLPIDDSIIRSAAAVEMVHNVSLIIDDILDRSRYRRGSLTLHCRFGSLPALMASGYITSDAFDLCSGYPYGVRLLSDLLKRLGVAECLQWRLRRQPLGVEDWRHLAGEDTGTMFETCACFGTDDERLRYYGRLLGMLYHGCDDVGDVRGAVALGGGGDEDLRDGILTLPTAIAIRDPEVALLFGNPSPETEAVLTERVAGAIPAAERYLDGLAEEAIREAERAAPNPRPLIDLVVSTRRLSS